MLKDDLFVNLFRSLFCQLPVAMQGKHNPRPSLQPPPQEAICNLYKPYNAPFQKNESKFQFGGAVSVGGVVKVVGRGGLVKLHILILPMTKVFDKKYIYNVVCRLDLAFPYLFYRKFPLKSRFKDFFGENRFLPILCVYF